MKAEYIFFILGFFLTFAILTFHLTTNPPGFFIDESIHGYEAYSLLTNKGHSSNGEFLPLTFLNPGEKIRQHFAYIYFLVPSLLVFGRTEFAVRFPSVVFSLISFCFLFILLRKRVSHVARFIILLSWPFSGWVFLLSRIGMEHMVTLTIFLGIFLLLLHVYEAKNSLSKRVSIEMVTVSILLGILFYVYAAGRVLAVLLWSVCVFLFTRKKYGAKSVLLFLILFQVSILFALPAIINGSFFYRFTELNTCLPSIPICILRNLLSHFNPILLFGLYIPSDYPVLTHSIWGASLLPIFLLPFLYSGILVTLYKSIKGDFYCRMITLFTLVSMIPSSLTIRGFDSYRSSSLLPMMFLLSAQGLEYFLTIGRVKNFLKGSRIFTNVYITFFFLSFMAWNMSYFYQYEFQTGVADGNGWQYGFRQILAATKKYESSYDEIDVTSSIAFRPSLYIRFFDPTGSTKLRISNGQNDPSKRTLYVVRPNEVKDTSFFRKETIYYPNGKDSAFYIGEFEKSVR